jgi:isopentenyl-diphosphate delta-isomerase
MSNDQVILVDENNFQRGVMSKAEAHKKAELHRAFSIFIFNSSGELLLQKRALSKYHSGGKWTNTCCGHPQPETDIKVSAHIRLNEEMGFDCNFDFAFNFIYKTAFDNGLFEHELDHVFVGYSDQPPIINLVEVSEWEYQNISLVQKNVNSNPEQFTVWFRIILPKLVEYLQHKK